jgi:hypothetical protein
MICDNCLIKSICRNGCDKLLNYINLNKLKVEDFSGHKNLSYRLMSILHLDVKTFCLNEEITIKINKLKIRWYKNGQIHREDGPAVEEINGDKSWYKNDLLHREDGPAIECADGSKRWYKNDLLHRENGPAIEFKSGAKSWYRNGKLHRDDDGPSVEDQNGTKKWYKNNKLHRKNGPAVEYASGSVYWY